MAEVIEIHDSPVNVPTKNFQYASWGFDEFNPVQSSVLEHHKGGSNIAIASQTNSGKTVCAEIFMSYEVRKRKGKAIYVGPFKSFGK